MKKTNISLIPDITNPSPDYFCTWQTQLYATCDGKPENQRKIIGERALFENRKPFGWAYFYEKARKDLFFVMDDSWDVPLSADKKYFGSLILSNEKFPGFVDESKNNVEALKKLSDKIKSIGWKGLGGWLCAQQAPINSDMPIKDYWTLKFREADESGFVYWKVDWGKDAKNFKFRKMLTDMAKDIAPNLTIEHSMIKEIIPYTDVYRTYDVPAIMSIPMTMEKIEDFSLYHNTEFERKGLINCEDEVYMAAAGGFTMGIMRHPYAGCFVDGQKDMSFPEIHRNLKTKMYEVIRAVRWHRVAPAFGLGEGPVATSEEELCDFWNFDDKMCEMEEWWFECESITKALCDNILSKSAPASISRRCTPPTVVKDNEGQVPFVVASHNPNGVFSIATLGRTMGRKYYIPKCEVVINIDKSDTIGVFGEYKKLVIKHNKATITTVLMQDISGETAYDISEQAEICEGAVIISGELIHSIGTLEQPADDTSEPGVVIKLF